MRIGRNTEETRYIMTRKDEEGDTIPVQLKAVEVENDLGIYVDSNLDFKTHIYQAAAETNILLGMIRRSFEHLDRDMILNLYKGQVRSLLEYGHSVWFPHHAGLIDENRKREGTTWNSKSHVPDSMLEDNSSVSGWQTSGITYQRKWSRLLLWTHSKADSTRPGTQGTLCTPTRSFEQSLQNSHAALKSLGTTFLSHACTPWN